MKITVTKKWFRSRAPLEEGLVIRAGSFQHGENPAVQVVPSRVSVANVVTQKLCFGRFVCLMRRKRQWSIKKLANEAEATCEELLSIENDVHYEPEASTVFGLAKSFGVAAKSLYKMAGLADDASPRFVKVVRFAACSEFKEPLTDSEDMALQAYLKVILEDSDQK